MLSILVVAFLAELSSYRAQKKILELETSSKLESIAKSIALEFPVDHYKKLLKTFTEKDAIKSNVEDLNYYTIQQYLRSYSETHDLNTNIYTLTRNESDQFEFIVSANNPFFRHKYGDPNKQLIENYTKGGRILEYETANGSWISAFAPIKDEIGITIGVVHVDENANIFHAKARKILFQNMFAAFIALSFLALLIFLFAKRSFSTMFSFAKTLDGQVQERTKALNESNEQLVRINNNLEQMVQDKTEELTKKNEALLRINEELSKFASVASHDMKEPLRTITSYAQLAKRRSKDDANSKELLEFIEDASRRMQTLLSDLLEYTKSGINKIELVGVDLNNIMILVQSNIRSRIEETAAIINIPSDLAIIEGKQTYLLLVFQNLISNAIKYQLPGSRPVIDIVQNVDTINNCVYISVKDNGLGIPEDKLEEIFEPFRRLHARSEYEGTGVGLATVKRIMEKLGGKIVVESKEGVGSIFTLKFKLYKEATKIVKLGQSESKQAKGL